MKKQILIIGTVAVLVSCCVAFTQYIWADTANVTSTFAVENMTCAACPITVKKAMSRVDGVQSIVVDFEDKTATATYDPARATSQEIAAASTAIGYPATLIEKAGND